MLGRDFASFIAHAFAHRIPEIARIDKLNLSLALLSLTIRQHPHISRDPGIIEKLLGQSNNRLQPVVLQNPAPDLALPAASISGKERRTIHHNRDLRTFLIRIVHMRQHDLQEEELSIADTRQARAKAAMHTL